jgi:hypothetical protein
MIAASTAETCRHALITMQLALLHTFCSVTASRTQMYRYTDTQHDGFH